MKYFAIVLFNRLNLLNQMIDNFNLLSNGLNTKSIAVSK